MERRWGCGGGGGAVGRRAVAAPGCSSCLLVREEQQAWTGVMSEALGRGGRLQPAAHLSTEQGRAARARHLSSRGVTGKPAQIATSKNHRCRVFQVHAGLVVQCIGLPLHSSPALSHRGPASQGAPLPPGPRRQHQSRLPWAWLHWLLSVSLSLTRLLHWGAEVGAPFCSCDERRQAARHVGRLLDALMLTINPGWGVDRHNGRLIRVHAIQAVAARHWCWLFKAPVIFLRAQELFRNHRDG